MTGINKIPSVGKYPVGKSPPTIHMIGFAGFHTFEENIIFGPEYLFATIFYICDY